MTAINLRMICNIKEFLPLLLVLSGFSLLSVRTARSEDQVSTAVSPRTLPSIFTEGANSNSRNGSFLYKRSAGENAVVCVTSQGKETARIPVSREPVDGGVKTGEKRRFESIVVPGNKKPPFSGGGWFLGFLSCQSLGSFWSFIR